MTGPLCAVSADPRGGEWGGGSRHGNLSARIRLSPSVMPTPGDRGGSLHERDKLIKAIIAQMVSALSDSKAVGDVTRPSVGRPLGGSGGVGGVAKEGVEAEEEEEEKEVRARL